jgi:hypothetical protein
MSFFCRDAQIVSSGGQYALGSLSGLSHRRVERPLDFTDVDDATVSARGKGRRVWTAFVNMREPLPVLLYLHVSPARF